MVKPNTESTAADAARNEEKGGAAKLSPCAAHAYQPDPDEQLTGDASDGCGEGPAGDGDDDGEGDQP